MVMNELDEGLVVLLAGYRYSGRSLVLQRLELSGYSCVDNLPPGLVTGYLGHGKRAGKGLPFRSAIAVDTDGAGGPAALLELLAELDKAGQRFKLVFMEAGDSALLERMEASDTVAGTSSPDELAVQREALAAVRTRADLILDSSYMSPLEERDRIIALSDGQSATIETAVDIMSFGFKHGAASGDVVVDVRFIPNPYYVAALRPLCGKDAACAEYVLGHESARGTVASLALLLQSMVPAYSAQGRGILKVRIGCTGGRHRSVAVAEALAATLREHGIKAAARHRELDSGRL